jgi:heat shock protein HspQ
MGRKIRLSVGKSVTWDPRAILKSGNQEMLVRTAKFGIGQIVQHRKHPFRGVIFDADPIFYNSEKWLNSIPKKGRPSRDQPYYHLFAENSETSYIAYVSEQNLLLDETAQPVSHPAVGYFFFEKIENGEYKRRPQRSV